MTDTVLIVDFGSQVTQLIARRVRDAGVYSEIAPFDKAEAAFARLKPKAVVFSGGPASVLDKDAPLPPPSLYAAGVPILGTTPSAIDLAEERGLFAGILDEAGLVAPRNGTAVDFPSAAHVAEQIGYPVLVRPSFVLGGRGMEIVYDSPSLADYFERVAGQGIVGPAHPLLVDRFLEAYEPPAMDPDVRAELDAFVERRVAEGGVPTDY